MPLSVGDRLGPYEILAHIGAGGMGEVWKARDTRLGRDVAIKISNAEFTERFAREARSIAALNHPNICTLYDVGPNYLVMEYIEGETLQGPLPLEDALRIARQIADALEAAHEKNIVHRDLKPGNVKIRSDGTVKVLDFGLAKVAEPQPEERTTESPTLTMRATQAGVILGTAAYMSPEQARGKPVDKRSDIWAFGVVLYEILTGRQLFEGETVPDILIAVCSKEPDWSRVPAKVRRLLRRCLERDPKKRLHDIADAWALLDDEPRAPAPSQSRLGWIVAGIAVVVAGLALWAPWRATQKSEQPLVRLDVDLGPDVSLGSPFGPGVIISPDGSRLVYVSQGKLFSRRFDQPKAAELAGTEGAVAPFFSPDGKWIAFFTPGKLKKISVEGGAPTALCDTSGIGGGSWGQDGNIIAAISLFGGLSRISAAGGAPMPVIELDRERGELFHGWPQILPGGKAVLFTANTTTGAFDRASIEVATLADGKRRTLHRGGTFGRYLPSGHLVYVNQGTLFAVPFDPDRLEVRDTPVPVVETVAYSADFGSAQFDFSGNGVLVYRRGAVTGRGRPVTVQWIDSVGKTQSLLARPGPYEHPRISPDGQRLAMEMYEGPNPDIWVYESQRDTLTRLTFGESYNGSPLWSPDGHSVVFAAEGRGIYWTRADGAGQANPLTQSKNVQLPQSFTPDGKRLSFFQLNPGTLPDIWTLPVDIAAAGSQAGKPELFLKSPFRLRDAAFSPDGHWLAYTSDESGMNEVYVRAFPDKGNKWQVSNSGGAWPIFSRNGRELFFEALDNRIMVAAYTAKVDSFVADKPRVWFNKPLGGGRSGSIWNYDLAPDGKRIAALMFAEPESEQKPQSQVILLQNFFDEVRRRVPATSK